MAGDTLRNMYKVHRNGGTVSIIDWKDTVVYSADKDSILLYETIAGVKVANRLEQMTDEQLLLALSKAVKLDL